MQSMYAMYYYGAGNMLFTPKQVEDWGNKLELTDLSLEHIAEHRGRHMTPTGADRHPWPKLNPSLRHYIPAALTPDLLSPRYPPHQPTRPPCLTNFYQRGEF